MPFFQPRYVDAPYIVRVVENSPQSLAATDTIDDGIGQQRPGSQLVVPDSKEWEVIHLRLQWTASADLGTRQPILQIRSPTLQRIINRFFGNAAANQVIAVEWGNVGHSNRGADTEGATFVQNEANGSPDVRNSGEITKLILPEDFQIAFFDLANIAAANTVIIRLLVMEREIAVDELGRQVYTTPGRRPR